MARTPSNMIELGSIAPDFNLPDVVSGEVKNLNDFKSEKATVIMFICNHCPFVKHVNIELVRLAKDFQPKGVEFVAISSNDVENYPDDSPSKMKENAREEGFTFPYLYDESQEVAKSYDAACTPDFYIYDKDLRLVYRGQLDDSRPGNNKELNGFDMRKALNQILAGEIVFQEQKPSIGCNIKWKQ